jgi:hypothetical protein
MGAGSATQSAAHALATIHRMPRSDLPGTGMRKIANSRGYNRQVFTDRTDANCVFVSEANCFVPFLQCQPLA